MAFQELRHRRAPASHGASTPTVVDSVRRFAGQPGIYEVRWRDGRAKRRILVVVDQWTVSDQTVAEAVAREYPVDQRPTVVVPPRAWR